MIVAYTSGGRTGNELYMFLYLLAAALEHHWSFRMWSFSSCHEFEFFGPGKGVCSYHPRRNKILCNFDAFLLRCHLFRLFGFFSRLFRVHLIYNQTLRNAELTERLRTISPGSLVLMNCWPFLDFDLLRKHTDEVRKAVRPKKEYWERAGQIIEEQRRHGVPVVGVHIRRTDYAEWRGGEYFFEVSVYERCMRKISELLHGEVSFVICSDEDMTKHHFDVPCRSLYISRNPFLVDFSLLAHCDYTIGPPSTFRLTASFLGATPTFRIVSSDCEPMSMDEFVMPMYTTSRPDA